MVRARTCLCYTYRRDICANPRAPAFGSRLEADGHLQPQRAVARVERFAWQIEISARLDVEGQALKREHFESFSPGRHPGISVIASSSRRYHGSGIDRSPS